MNKTNLRGIQSCESLHKHAINATSQEHQAPSATEYIDVCKQTTSPSINHEAKGEVQKHLKKEKNILWLYNPHEVSRPQNAG